MGKPHIGIISAPDHAKGLSRMLSAKGYRYTLLGYDPNTIPNTFDVLVCRVKSCSHGAYNLAITAQRQGEDVIFENGSTRVVEALKQIEAGTFVSVAPTNVESAVGAPNASKPVKLKPGTKPGMTLPDAIEHLVGVGGFFCRWLRKLPASDVVSLYAAVSGTGDEVKEAINLLWAASRKSIPAATTEVRQRSKFKEQFGFTPRSGVRAHPRPVVILVKEEMDEQTTEIVCSAMGLFTSKEAAEAAAAEPKAKPREEKKVTLAPTPPPPLPPPPPKPEPKPKPKPKPEPEPKPLVAAEVTRKTDAEELDEMLFFLREKMADMDLEKCSGHGIEVVVQTVHLDGPEGPVCMKGKPDGASMTRNPSEVNCKRCQTTKAFTLAQFYLQGPNPSKERS